MTFAWFDCGDGRQVYRKVPEDRPARSSLPCPRLILDEMPAVKSMADGKMYTSKAKMRQSYLPNGNPQGARYVEVGNEYDKPFNAPETKIDTSKIDNALNKAVARYQAGERV